MSNPFHQVHWIEPLAAMERERRDLIARFQQAAPAFIGFLVKAMESDAQKYRDHFEAEGVLIKPDMEKGSIEIVCVSYITPTRGLVQLHSESQVISCEYDGPIASQNWEDALEVTQLGLQCGQLAPEYCAKELSQKILKPVLFPSL